MPNTPRRIFRFPLLILSVLISTYLVIIIALAWHYSYSLTHPECKSAKRIENIPEPQKIFLTSQDGTEIPTWYYPTQNGAAIVVMGGVEGALGDNPPPVVFLIQEGYGVLQIGSRACANPRRAVTLGWNETKDALAGVEFLQTRPDIERIGVFGFSMGGAAVLQAAAQNVIIQAVVAEGNYYNLGDDILETSSNESWMHKFLLYMIAGCFWIQTNTNPWLSSPIDALPKISPRAVFLIFGEHEAGSGHASDQFAATMQPKQLWIVPGGDHGTNHRVATQAYEQQISEFFKHYLGKENTSR